MAYSQNIPQPTDELKDSQADLLANFQAIKAAFDINHVTFDLADEGKHNYVSFPEQAAGPATAANELALYSKESTLTSVAELFVRKESSGDEIEFTSSLQATDGWSRLPSGILIKWGYDSTVGAGTITFPVAATIPVFTNVFVVLLTVLDAGAGDGDKAIRCMSSTTTSFDAFASNRSTIGAAAVAFNYLAIGI